MITFTNKNVPAGVAEWSVDLYDSSYNLLASHPAVPISSPIQMTVPSQKAGVAAVTYSSTNGLTGYSLGNYQLEDGKTYVVDFKAGTLTQTEGFSLEMLLPMSPMEGPPLPRFLGVYWPWYKGKGFGP